MPFIRRSSSQGFCRAYMKPQSYERKILKCCNANTPLIKNLDARIAIMECACVRVTLETFET